MVSKRSRTPTHPAPGQVAERRVTTLASVAQAIAQLTARNLRVSVRNIQWALANFRPGERRGSPNRILIILRVLRQRGVPTEATLAGEVAPPSTEKPLLVGSLCSGLDAPALALAHIGGWRTAWCAEIDAEASALLARRHRTRTVPEPGGSVSGIPPVDSRVPNFGNILRPDFVELATGATGGRRLDLVVGGSPCTAFSQAGLRQGLNDPAGQLAFRFLDICNQLNPRLVLWENVAAVLTDSQNAFGLFIAHLVGLPGQMLTPEGLVLDTEAHRHGYAWTQANAGYIATSTCVVAWRVFNALYMGTPQHRERILVLASRDPQVDPRELLFELLPTGVPGPAPEEHPATIDQMILDEISIRIRGDASALPSLRDTTIVVRAPYTQGSHGCYRPGVGTLRASGGDLGGGSETLLVPVEVRIMEPPSVDDQGRLTGGTYEPVGIQPVRGLDIMEGERLTGVPDGYTRLPTRKLSQRWKRLGNAIAVPMLTPLLRRMTAALQQPQVPWCRKPWCTVEHERSGVQWALFDHAERTAGGPHIQAQPWPITPTYSPLADILVPEDCVPEHATISAAGARGIVIRHLLRGKRVHPLLVRGCVETVAHVLHEEECSPAARAAAAFAILRGCFQDPALGMQAVQRLLPDLHPDLDLVVEIERILKPYGFRTTIGAKQVRQQIDGGIFADDWQGIQFPHVQAVLGNPFLPVLRGREITPAHRTADALVACYAAGAAPFDARFLAGTGNAWGPAMQHAAGRVVAMGMGPQALTAVTHQDDHLPSAVHAGTVPLSPVPVVPVMPQASPAPVVLSAAGPRGDVVEPVRQLQALIQSLVGRHDLAAAARLADAQAEVLHLWSDTHTTRVA